jgi:UDPglucose 6-dehydrogenase
MRKTWRTEKTIGELTMREEPVKDVGIIGNGWVGKAMQQLFPDAPVFVRDVKKAIDDRFKEGAKAPREFAEFTDDKEVINRCNVVFICVPTPVIGEGRLDTSIVEECISWAQSDLIVVRSTVNPGDCDQWMTTYGKQIVMQPEYLGETPNHPLLDTKNTPFLIIGGKPEAQRKLIETYQAVYNANTMIRQVSALEAEIIKLSENRAIIFKVSQCQELYDVCEAAGVDYYKIRDAVYGDDPRFNLWWTFIYPDKRGFNSKCVPKDIYAWCAWAESVGYEPKITRAILEKNKEWITHDVPA